MAQDWFAANAPKKAQASAPTGDWFASNAPKPQPSAPTEHPHARVARGVIDAGKGALAGVASGMFHGGDLIRRGLGMERVIDRPEVQRAMTPPQNLPGQIGFYGEQAAEFIAPLGQVARITKGMPILKRMAAEGAAGAGVAAVQSGGDTRDMALAGAVGAAVPGMGAGLRLVKNTAQKAAAGAAEGGLGGAVAEAVRSSAPMSSRAMLFQGLKPRNTRVNFMSALDATIPEIKASEAALGKSIENIDDLIQATTLAKKRIRAEYDAIAGPKRDAGTIVDLSGVAESISKSIPSKLRLENPERADAIRAVAEKYRGKFSLEQAEQLLKETNGELEAFYNKFPLGQRRALVADPEAARLDAQAKALRDAIYKTLDNPAQPGAARALNKKYGQLIEIEDTATRRANVSKRQQPESLNEQFSKARAAGEFAKGAFKIARGDLMGAADIASGKAMRDAAKFMKDQQTTDALIRRAFANAGKGR